MLDIFCSPSNIFVPSHLRSSRDKPLYLSWLSGRRETRPDAVGTVVKMVLNNFSLGLQLALEGAVIVGGSVFK